MEERTRLRKKLETWLEEVQRQTLIRKHGEEEEWSPPKLNWDDERSVFTYAYPPDLNLEPEKPAPARCWWPGFAFGIGAGAAFAVLCFLAARLVRSALTRRK